MAEKKISFAVIGAGNITNLRHIPTLKKLDRVNLLGIIDVDAAKAEKTAKKFKLPYFASSIDNTWFSNVEAVSIGVPPYEHAAVIKKMLNEGKHVLTEKPMTLKVPEAESLVALAAEKNKILAVVHNFQFAKSTLKLKYKIAKGELGEIKSILAFQASTTERRLPVWAEQLPLGLLFDEGSHLFYLLRAFGGNIKIQSVGVTHSTMNRQTPAIITAHMTAGDIPVGFCNMFEAPVSEWHFCVLGSKAVGIIDIFRDVLVVLPNDGQHLALDVMRTTFLGVGNHLWGVLSSGIQMLKGNLLYGNEEVFRRFLDAVESGKQPESISGEDGLQVVRALNEMIEMASGS